MNNCENCSGLGVCHLFGEFDDKWIPCEKCEGSGLNLDRAMKCPRCLGSGENPFESEGGITGMEGCRACNGCKYILKPKWRNHVKKKKS